jgi:hypothetical protein
MELIHFAFLVFKVMYLFSPGEATTFRDPDHLEYNWTNLLQLSISPIRPPTIKFSTASIDIDPALKGRLRKYLLWKKDRVTRDVAYEIVQNSGELYCNRKL